jgi:hypothetical protein
MRNTTVLRDIKFDTNSSHPIDLDSEQIEELEKLIENLKKEIVFPPKKEGEKLIISKAGRG